MTIIAELLRGCKPPDVLSDSDRRPNDEIFVSRVYFENYEANLGLIKGAILCMLALVITLSYKWPWMIKTVMPIVLFSVAVQPCIIPNTYGELLTSTFMSTMAILLLTGFPSWPHMLIIAVYPVTVFYAPFITVKPGTEEKRFGLTCFFIAFTVILSLALMHVLMENVKQSGKIRWQGNFNQRIVQAVPVGILCVQPDSPDPAKRYQPTDDESLRDHARYSGSFRLKFSNILADKIFTVPQAPTQPDAPNHYP